MSDEPASEKARVRSRRNELADWLFREHPGAPYTVGQIIDVSGVYDGLQDRDGKCRGDLRRLQNNGVVREYVGRPARWEHREA